MSELADTVVEENTKIKNDVPHLWAVIILNDDKTPMDFVIHLLQSVFNYSTEDATDLTLEVHESGSGVAGSYSYEIAEQLGLEATQLARDNGYPLKIQIKEE